MNAVKNKLKETRKKLGGPARLVDPEVFANYTRSLAKKWESCKKSPIGIGKDLMMRGMLGSPRGPQSNVSAQWKVGLGMTAGAVGARGVGGKEGHPERTLRAFRDGQHAKVLL